MAVANIIQEEALISRKSAGLLNARPGERASPEVWLLHQHESGRPSEEAEEVPGSRLPLQADWNDRIPFTSLSRLQKAPSLVASGFLTYPERNERRRCSARSPMVRRGVSTAYSICAKRTERALIRHHPHAVVSHALPSNSDSRMYALFDDVLKADSHDRSYTEISCHVIPDEKLIC